MPRKQTTDGIPLSELAAAIQGKVIGNPKILVTGICPVDAPQAGCLSFVRSTNAREIEALAEGGKILVLLLKDAKGIKPKGDTFALVEVEEPLSAVIKLVPLFFQAHAVQPGVSPRAEVHPSAKIGKGASIGAFCCVGADAEIEEDVVLHPHVILYPGAKIGARSVVHSGATVREDCVVGADSVIQNGAVIGADGFGYVPDPALGLKAVPQVGNVVLADRVEVGANACVDRGTFGSTEIGWGTKLDNLVQVGHNTKIGKHSILCGLTGVAGSCEIGDRVVLGGHSGVADHRKIISGCRIAAKSGVIQDLEEKGDYAGMPAIPSQQWLKQMSILRRLPDLIRHLRISTSSKHEE